MIRLLTTAFWLALCVGPPSALADIAPYCLSCQAEAETFVVVWYYQGVNVVTYANDHGELDNYFFVVDYDRDNRAAGRFTGIESDYPLQSVSIFIWGSDPFPQLPGGPDSPIALSLYEQLPTTVDATPFRGEDTVAFAPVPLSGGWFEHHLGWFPPPGDTVYVQAHWLSETPTAPLLAVDYMPGGVTHSYYGYRNEDKIVWTPDYGQDLLIRLNSNVPDTLSDYRQPCGLPDSFALYLDPDSTAVTVTDDVFLSITDSLHVTLNRDLTEGNYLAVAAWSDGLPGERSRPLLLPARPKAPFPLRFEPDSLLVRSAVGEQVEQTITLTNPQEQSISYSIEWSRQDADWLTVEPDSGAIQSLSELSLLVTVDNHTGEPGCYHAELLVHCSGDGIVYEAGACRVFNDVAIVTSVESWGQQLPAAGSLQQNFPNPFNDRTCIYSGSADAVHIYNLAGQLVRLLHCSGGADPSAFLFLWDGTDLTGRRVSSGVYLYTQSRNAPARKLLLLK